MEVIDHGMAMVVVRNPEIGVLIAESVIPELSFESNMGIIKVTHDRPGEWVLHLYPGTNLITFKAEGYKTVSDVRLVVPKKRVRKVEVKPLERVRALNVGSDLSEKTQEAGYVPDVAIKSKSKLTPKHYLTLSFGSSRFPMTHLDAYKRSSTPRIRNVGPIREALSLECSVGLMVTRAICVGLSIGLLRGVASGEYYSYDHWNYIEEVIEVTGVTLALRPVFRRQVGDSIALCLGCDMGVINMSYSELRDFGSYVLLNEVASAVGPLLGGFVSVQLPIENFFLQADIGFRSAKGEVERKNNLSEKLDFSGPYALMTAGARW